MAPCEHTSKLRRCGTRSQGVSQFYLPAHPAYIRWRNEPYRPKRRNVDIRAIDVY